MSQLLANGLNFEDMFELAPVSLWMEDYSGLKQLFDQWRAQGVTDLLAHVQADPLRLQQCSEGYRVLRVNQCTLQLLKAPDVATLQNRLKEVFSRDMHLSIQNELLAMWNGQLGFENLTVNYALDGTRLDVLVTARVLPGFEDTWERVLVSVKDMTAEVQSQRQLQSSEQYARNLFEHSPVSLWVEDFSAIKDLLDEVRAQGITDFRTFLHVHPDFVRRCMQEIRVVDVNQQTLSLFGAGSKDMLMHNLDRIFRDEMEDSFAQQLLHLWEGKLVQQFEVVNYALNGEKLHIHLELAIMDTHAERWDLVLLSLVDITARRKAEAYLEYLGKHDVLTQLRNRAFYTEELNRIARKGPWPLAVIAIDMNGLKAINDEHGHAAGDAMLRRVGEVLGKAVDPPACAARVGGDEFMVLLPRTDERGAFAMQERIVSLLELNNQFYPGQTIYVSIGVACGTAQDDVEHIVQRADQAMYVEKARFYAARDKNRRQLLPA